jgi:hypothetical protein
MTDWTTPADVTRKLRRRWDTGDLLRQWGGGEAWQPLGIRLRRPTAREITADLAAAQRWAATWDRAGHVRIEHQRIGGRLVGSNDLPARAWIDSYEQLWSLLGVAPEAEAFRALQAQTSRQAPRLVEWMLAHPLQVLDRVPVWPALIATVLWIDAHSGPAVYVRQVDVPGVDTKFIERHQGTLAALLDAQLDPARVDSSRPRSEFTARYGFRSPPNHIWLRSLDPDRRLAAAYAELAVRREDLATTPPPHSTVYVVENKMTYLAFPNTPDAIAIFGGGYAVSALAEQRWLADRNLYYAGDIDTHGFVILDRLRQRFQHTRSLLMDRATLLAHENQWVQEPEPVASYLAHLGPAETDLYRDLVEDALGVAVRLEQERISYSAIEAAVRPSQRINPGPPSSTAELRVGGKSAGVT